MAVHRRADGLRGAESVSDKPIGVGDLVMVVRQPCCCVDIGKVFRVANVFTHKPGVRCSECRTTVRESTVVENEVITAGGLNFAPLSWLKRIDPLPESEDVPSAEELEA